jgi:MHS family metabolite:H+ symporter-like MFS transporter
MIGAGLMALAITAEGGTGVVGAGTGAWLPIAGYLSLLTAITIAVTFAVPETAGRSLEDRLDAIQEKSAV